MGVARYVREIFFSSGRYGSTMRVYVVDNGGQWTHREWRGLKELRAAAKKVADHTPGAGLGGPGGGLVSRGAPPGGGGAGEKGRGREGFGSLLAPLPRN